MKTGGALLITVSCLAMTQAADADTRDAGEPLVILTEQGSTEDAEAAAFLSSVRALAAEIGIVVSTEEVPSLGAVRDTLLAEARGQRKPFLVAWIVRESKLRTIHLFDPWNNQLRARAVDAGESATANAEALALILRAELLAYLHQPPPPPPPQPPPPPPPPQPPPPPPPDPRWAVTASYSFGTFLRDQGLDQGARLGISHMWDHLRLGVAYSLFPGQEVAGQGAVIVVRRHPVDLDLGYASSEYRRLRWAAEILASGDWVSRRTSDAELPLSSEPDAGYLLLSLGARVRQELRLFRNLALGLAVGLDVPLNPIEFKTARGTSTQTLARVSPVCFRAELGIKVPAF